MPGEEVNFAHCLDCTHGGSCSLYPQEGHLRQGPNRAGHLPSYVMPRGAPISAWPSRISAGQRGHRFPARSVTGSVVSCTVTRTSLDCPKTTNPDAQKPQAGRLRLSFRKAEITPSCCQFLRRCTELPARQPVGILSTCSCRSTGMAALFREVAMLLVAQGYSPLVLPPTLAEPYVAAKRLGADSRQPVRSLRLLARLNSVSRSALGHYHLVPETSLHFVLQHFKCCALTFPINEARLR